MNPDTIFSERIRTGSNYNSSFTVKVDKIKLPQYPDTLFHKVCIEYGAALDSDGQVHIVLHNYPSEHLEKLASLITQAAESVKKIETANKTLHELKIK